ncbi:MAG TPA: hypothetical protein PKD00_03115 [Burkholderiales bacterium]|nr:hypothetical protein [Burkholderiales bacterium]
MKTLKKILAGILSAIIFSALCAGLTQIVANDWLIGIKFTLLLYAVIAVLALIGIFIMLLEYTFKK